TPAVWRFEISLKVSRVIDPPGPTGAGDAAGSRFRAWAAAGRWIWFVTTAPNSMAAMATEKNDAIVRLRVFIDLEPPRSPRGPLLTETLSTVCKDRTEARPPAVPAEPSRAAGKGIVHRELRGDHVKSCPRIQQFGSGTPHQCVRRGQAVTGSRRRGPAPPRPRFAAPCGPTAAQ